MTAGELLSKAVDFISDASIDWHEVSYNAEYPDQFEYAEVLKHEIAGMQKLLSYLQKEYDEC